MCGRYRLEAGNENQKMQQIIEICNENAADGQRIKTDASVEVRPGDFAPALVLQDGKVSAASMQWGFSNGTKGLVINARSEDLQARQMFMHLERENRCVLLSSGYYEWRRGDGQKYLVSGQEVVYMAGLYRMEADGRRHFVILTKAAYGGHAKIHHRMPVILNTREAARAWLAGSVTAAQASAKENPGLTIEALNGEQVCIDF